MVEKEGRAEPKKIPLWSEGGPRHHQNETAVVRRRADQNQKRDCCGQKEDRAKPKRRLLWSEGGLSKTKKETAVVRRRAEHYQKETAVVRRRAEQNQKKRTAVVRRRAFSLLSRLCVVIISSHRRSMLAMCPCWRGATSLAAQNPSKHKKNKNNAKRWNHAGHVARIWTSNQKLRQLLETEINTRRWRERDNRHFSPTIWHPATLGTTC